MRYALYFVPPPQSALSDLAAQWLGRDLNGAPLREPALEAMDPETWRRLTAEPRRYGFHATLKPPFRLKPGTTEGDLVAAATVFAAGRGGFEVPAMRLGRLGRFYALIPAERSAALDELAAATVEAFEPFRAPAEEAELARRRRAGLTPRQEALLETWGYPYVFEEFRFHMTLTGPVEDEALREAVERELRRQFAPVEGGALSVEALALCYEPAPGEDFALIARLPFGQ